MYFLNNLKEFSIYKKKTLIGIDSNYKNTDLKKNSFIMFASLDNSISSLLNMNILSKSYFKSYYVPKKFNTNKRNLIVKNDTKRIYEKVKSSSPNIQKMKLSIKDYNQRNLIYDLSYEIQANTKEIKINGLKKSKIILDYIGKSFNSIKGYKQKALFIPVTLKEIIDMNSNPFNESIFSYMYTNVMKNMFPESLKNIRIVLYTEKGYMATFIYDDPNKKAKLVTMFNKMKNIVESGSNIVVEDELDSSISSNNTKTKMMIDKTQIVEDITTSLLEKINIDKDNIPNDNVQKLVDELYERINEKVNIFYEQMDSNNSKLNDTDYNNIMENIKKDEYIVSQISIISDSYNKGLNTEKQIIRLKVQQEQALENLDEIIAEVNTLKIDTTEIENENILNEEAKHNSLKDFDKSYVEKQMKKDIVNILQAFNNDPDVKLFVKNVKMENTSDYFNKKVTYHITFVDDRKRVHNVSIDYPILKDNAFMIIGGGKKLIQKQFLLYPIVKTKSNEVQITTSYNKMIIRRFGNKLNAGTEAISKFFLEDIEDFIQYGKKLEFTLGNNTKLNKYFITSLEYDQLASSLSRIITNDFTVLFDQNELVSIMLDSTSDKLDPKLSKLFRGKNENKYDQDTHFLIGYTNDKKKVILGSKHDFSIYYFDGEKITPEFISLTEFINKSILEPNIDSKKMDEYYKFKAPSTMMYNRIKINNKHIPIIIVLSYEKGITNILNRYGLEYEFKKGGRFTKKYGKKAIRFQDGYLIYNSLDLKATLLLDGLNLMDTENYDFEMFNEKEPYLEYFYDAFGSRNIGKGIHNTLTLMLQDPITLDCLKMLKLPDNIYDLLLYANTLLTDSTYNPGNDLNNYRLRGAEQLNSKLYKILANAFRSYKDTLGNANPVKINIPRDALIKEMISEKTVDEYSILNPSLEVDKISAVTFKGPSGKLMPH